MPNHYSVLIFIVTFFVIATKKVRSVILSVCEGSPFGERFKKKDVSLTLNMTGKPDRSARSALPAPHISYIEGILASLREIFKHNKVMIQ